MSLRVNPTDAMAIVDVIDTIGVSKENLSFAQATKIALSTLLESARQQGTIPRREGFEYLEMMKPFEADNYSSRAAKLRITKELNKPPTDNVPVPQLDKTQLVRFEELMVKHQHAPDSMEASEIQELTTLLEKAQ